ncbi:MAG: RNA polymerase sigma factor, partial [Sciscionella sp.]
YRQRERRPGLVEYRPEVDVRTVASAESDVTVRLASTEVLSTLAQLPADQRDVLALRFVADLSLEQVADIIGRSVGAVKQLQRRGLLTVRAVLAERGVTR